MTNYKILFSVLTFLLCIVTSSCSEEEDVTQTSIQYTLTISPDLLKFVTPQVNYVDENGVLVTISGVEELDGLVLENKAEISSNGGYASGWTQQIITGTGYKCWTINMKFKHENFHTRMWVNYLPKEITEDIENKSYNIHHSINTSIVSLRTISSKSPWEFSQSSNAYVDSYVSIGNLDYHPGDNLKMYLDNLYQNPDKVGYYIKAGNDVVREDDFDI